ncbi:Elongation factor Ts [Candidatus Arcanobacter lacustris]|uniref:Elongation factor Ts n=1 Tax=Candidatus Arcanibacter lacustris TaxID=1607817 RepID=A0A0F5MN51_9RICK|nr:Elongation factor Ts [Candidatus Arcanobacter lacustris]
MAEITASLVKELREKTGAGMMDCKKALVEVAGNFEEAIDWLRKKGLSNAAKKSGRVAAEGLVAVAVSDKKGALIELNSETDFVARNEKFQQLVKTISELALANMISDVELLKNIKNPATSATVAEDIASNVAVIGEHMNLRRTHSLSVDQGVVVSYVHNAVVPNCGKIGVLVALESGASKDELTTLGRQLAMHVAASKPDVLTIAEVDPVAVEREKTIFSEQAKASGKPDSIIEKMVEGRIRKYYEEVVLLEQVFVIDGKTKVSEVLEQFSKKTNSPTKIKAFTCYVLGDGIVQEQKNFADEVAAVRG